MNSYSVEVIHQDFETIGNDWNYDSVIVLASSATEARRNAEDHFERVHGIVGAVALSCTQLEN